MFDSDTYSASYVCMLWFVPMCMFDSDAYIASYVCMFGLCPCVCLIVKLTVHRMFVCLVCVHVYV